MIVATLAVFLTSTALTAASDAAAGDLAPPDRRESCTGWPFRWRSACASWKSLALP